MIILKVPVTLQGLSSLIYIYNNKTLTIMKAEEIKTTRVNNDVNGNPRYAVSFLHFITDKDQGDISDKYDLAVKRAKALGGKKYHNKQYGGGIVFQSYNERELRESIVELASKL